MTCVAAPPTYVADTRVQPAPSAGCGLFRIWPAPPAYVGQPAPSCPPSGLFALFGLYPAPVYVAPAQPVNAFDVGVDPLPDFRAPRA